MKSTFSKYTCTFIYSVILLYSTTFSLCCQDFILLDQDIHMDAFRTEIRFYNGSDFKGSVSKAGSDVTLYSSDGNVFVRSANRDARVSGDDIFLSGNTITLNNPGVSSTAILRSNPINGNGNLQLISNDDVLIDLNNNNDNTTGQFSIRDGDDENLFTVNEFGTVFMKGSVIVGTTLVHSSDRNKKEKIRRIDPQITLHQLDKMPIYQWQYKGTDRSHIGPMAQDFHEAFGLGDDNTTIAAIDADGVALAAIKGQQQIIKEQHKRIVEQDAEINDLQVRLERLEAMLLSGK